MKSQIDSLEEAYSGLQALRRVFRNVNQHSGFSIETVVPSRYLPELLVAAPVWFIESRKPVWFIDPVERWRKKLSGSENEMVRYFCNLGTTERFAHLFQMYNYTPRNFNEFKGRDIMPLPILELVRQVKNVFDYLVIATPYHDLASDEWRTAARWRWESIDPVGWRRNIDPFLFGFLKQIPELMFFLGRWSGTGVFPLVVDMMADTIEHIRKHEASLRGCFDDKIPWCGGGYVLMNVERLMSDMTVGMFVEDLLKAFKDNRLFFWLRGEN